MKRNNLKNLFLMLLIAPVLADNNNKQLDKKRQTTEDLQPSNSLSYLPPAPPSGGGGQYLPPDQTSGFGGPHSAYLPEQTQAYLPPAQPLKPPQPYLPPTNAYLPPQSHSNVHIDDFDYNSLGMGSLLGQVLAANHIAGVTRNNGATYLIGGPKRPFPIAPGYNFKPPGYNVQALIVPSHSYGPISFAGPLEQQYFPTGRSLNNIQELISSHYGLPPALHAGDSYSQAHHLQHQQQNGIPGYPQPHPYTHTEQREAGPARSGTNTIAIPINSYGHPQSQPGVQKAPNYSDDHKGLGQYNSKDIKQYSKAPFKPSTFLGMFPESAHHSYLPPHTGGINGNPGPVQFSYLPPAEANFVTPSAPHQPYDLPPSAPGKSYLPPSAPAGYNTIQFSEGH